LIFVLLNVSSTKKILLILSFPALLVVLVPLAKYKRWYALYSIPTTGMEPTFHPGQVVFGSSWCKKEKGDCVSYYPNPCWFDQQPKMEYLGRITADEFDTVRIVYGDLYINGEMVDDSEKVTYLFKIPASYYPLLKKKGLLFDEAVVTGDSLLFNGTYATLRTVGAMTAFTKMYTTDSTIDAALFEPESVEKWTSDNFGPVVVPEGNYFIMGDNRVNSADSRYRGFVPAEKVVAKVFE
jgi:signal peptidase I